MIDDADLLDYEPEEDDLHSNSQKDSTLNTANNGRLKLLLLTLHCTNSGKKVCYLLRLGGL